MKKLVPLSIATAVLSLALVSSASAPSFGGRAMAVQVRVPATGATITLTDSGQLPSAGGGIGAALLSADIPSGQTAGLVSLRGGTLHSAVVGVGGTHGEASLADLSLAISGNGITADFLMARSAAACGATATVTGVSQLANLVINGQTIAVTGAANQTVPLPNGIAVINEQLPSVAGGNGQITVNALHVTTRDALTGQALADVVLATADAEIQCETGSALSAPPAWAQSTDPNFATGGGWIPSGTGKATFGFVAGADQNGSVTGNLVYDDHDANFSLQSTAILQIIRATCDTEFSGTATTNTGDSVSFTVNVHDGGEPGRNDTFSIRTDGYANAGKLAGGNIQVDGSFVGGKVLAHGNSC
jgi:hypothetical protein